MVRNGDLFVPEVAVVLKHVGEVGRDVQDVGDVVLAQHVQVGGVFRTAQVEIRQDLNGEVRLVAGDGALLGLRGAAGLAVRLAVRTIRAEP